MALLTSRFKFTLPDDPALWRMTVEERVTAQQQHITIRRDGNIVREDIRASSTQTRSRPIHIDVEDYNLTLEFGAISLLKYGLIVRQDGNIIWRSHDKPFRSADKLDPTLKTLNRKAQTWETDSKRDPTDAQRTLTEQQKALRPSIVVDISFGILFFFVAREFGLITAALSGAAATLFLTAINPFVKWDLLGGFAAFGVVMALISAGLAWAFQDDLIIKLRGTIMALIGASFALFDACVLKGGYLGQRMALYMAGLGPINPRRASFALAGATLLITAIDTPLAFLLTTDQWIWYNTVLDSFIAIPIILVCMLLAREPKGPS